MALLRGRGPPVTCLYFIHVCTAGKRSTCDKLTKNSWAKNKNNFM